jgi:DNA-3-methyladenine glycosylase I
VTVTRCSWCGDLPDYVAYHDQEWGRPVVDDRRLFEKLCLEGFQSGLSWLTILRKRDAFRRAFEGFDPTVMARFDDGDVARLLEDRSIVRHRGKITAAVNNARRMLELQDEHGSLAGFVWDFEPEPTSAPVLRTTCPEATAFARELRRRGWQFVGPTTAYAFFQSMGLVNDHAEGCDLRADVDAERATLIRPRIGAGRRPRATAHGTG